MMPSAGPTASRPNASGQPPASRRCGTAAMEKEVSRKPIAVCRVSAVPTACSVASSVASALNCAESATTENPHRTAPATATHTGPRSSHPIPANRGALVGTAVSTYAVGKLQLSVDSGPEEVMSEYNDAWRGNIPAGDYTETLSITMPLSWNVKPDTCSGVWEATIVGS